MRLVETLLESKASLDPIIPTGTIDETPLSLIVRRKQMKEVARFILEHNYSEDFYVAVVAGDVDRVRTFFEAGGVVNDTKFGLNLREIAVLHGNADVLALILEYCPPVPEL